MTLDAALPEHDFDFVPAVRQGLVIRRLGNEAIAWSDIRPEPALLDPVATVLLDVVDGLGTTGDLIDDVQDGLGIDYYAARSQVLRVMSLFDSAGLLESSAPPEFTWPDGQSLLPTPDW